MKDYFYFEVGKNVRLVLPTDLVVETIALNLTHICPIPGVADMFLGVINYQGELIWVIDLAAYLSHLLGLSTVTSIAENSSTKNKLTVVILTPLNSQKEKLSKAVAWVVSEAHGIVSLNPAKFRPIPGEFISLFAPYLSGLTELESNIESKKSTTVAILKINFFEK